jgi:hypothetical protein
MTPPGVKDFTIRGLERRPNKNSSNVTLKPPVLCQAVVARRQVRRGDGTARADGHDTPATEGCVVDVPRIRR